MIRPRTSAPRGVTLVELMVACVVLAIFGGAAMRLFATQSHFVDQQQKARAARSVGRQSYVLLASEMRGVEATGGLVDAAPKSVTLRVPYQIGIVCDTQVSGTYASVVSADVFGGAVPSGYAWSDGIGNYTYDETPGLTAVPVDSTACVAQGIHTPATGIVVLLQPALPAGVTPASPIFLFQRVRYEFAASTAVPGRVGLWRTPLSTTQPEELAAPFDTSAGFRYFSAAADTSVALLPFSAIVGVDLVLVGSSERPRWGGTAPELASFHTGIFFGNRQ